MTTTTVILCGGKGTRAYPYTREVPKPLLEVAGEPVLRHVMDIYADQGFDRFVLAAGYLADQIISFARGLPRQWSVEVVDTGPDSGTGGRITKVRHLLEGAFFANYADGLGDVDLDALLSFHRSHDGVGTLTTVPLRSQYGTVEVDGAGRVRDFREKPTLSEHRINGGFFVFEVDALDQHWAGEDLENEVLPALGRLGVLHAYPHDGFWRSLDTYKDALELSSLAAGRAPWHRD